MRDKIVGNIFPLQLGLDIPSGCCPAVVVVALVAVVEFMQFSHQIWDTAIYDDALLPMKKLRLKKRVSDFSEITHLH